VIQNMIYCFVSYLGAPQFEHMMQPAAAAQFHAFAADQGNNQMGQQLMGMLQAFGLNNNEPGKKGGNWLNRLLNDDEEEEKLVRQANGLQPGVCEWTFDQDGMAANGVTADTDCG
jgi:hypothetical protein